MKMIDAPSVVVVVNPAELKPHPQNDYFFPAVGDDEDDQFVTSIRERGIINMPVITKDGVIISGHRRVNAAIKCGFTQIQCQQREYENDDLILYDLLASNLMSRGGAGALFSHSPVKGARVVKEFARLFGNADNQGRSNLSPIGMPMSVIQMGDELGMSRASMGRALQIAKIEEDIADELEGKASAAALQAVGKMLSPVQQRMLLELLPEGYEKFTMQQFQVAINEIKGYADEIEALNADIAELEDRLDRQVQKVSRLEEMSSPNCNLDEEIRMRQELEVKYGKAKAKIGDLQVRLAKAEKAGTEIEALRAQVEELKEELDNIEPETVEVEVVPDDYEELKERVDDLEARNAELQKEVTELREMDNLASFAMANIKTMKDMAGSIENEELTEQLGVIEKEMNKLIARVSELRKG